MAARNRDAIFELVVLKEKGDRERKQEGAFQDFQCTERSRPNPAEPTYRISGHEDTRNSITEADDHFMMANASFDNAAYYCNKDNKEITKKHEKNSSLNEGKFLMLLCLIALAFLILLVGVVIGVCLASVNTLRLAQLKQTAVDNASYQMTNEGQIEMLKNLQGHVAQLNESISMLREQMSMMSDQLDRTDSVLAERIDSLMNDTDSLEEATLQLNSTLLAQSSRIDNISLSQISITTRLGDVNTSLSNSLDQVKNDVAIVERKLETSVDLFGSCDSVVSNRTLSFSSEDPELMFSAETSSINADSTVSW